MVGEIRTNDPLRDQHRIHDDAAAILQAAARRPHAANATAGGGGGRGHSGKLRHADSRRGAVGGADGELLPGAELLVHVGDRARCRPSPTGCTRTCTTTGPSGNR